MKYQWIVCNHTKQIGRFLFWRWELWEVGGGAGVEWYFCGKEINVGEWNPLWTIFNIQRRKK